MVRDRMAIFRLNAAIISACTGGSAVRAAAYRHAVRMVSHAFTETTSFTHKAQAMVHAEVALPEDAPEWAENAFGHGAFADALRLVRADVQAQGSDMSEAAMQRAAMARVSERLWNAVEHGELRLNRIPTRAQYARSLIVALPRELDQAAQIALMQGYVRVSFCDRGMVAGLGYSRQIGRQSTCAYHADHARSGRRGLGPQTARLERQRRSCRPALGLGTARQPGA